MQNKQEKQLYLSAALKTGKWLIANFETTKYGFTWPTVPGQMQTASHLYSGTAGITLYFLEASYLTGNKQYLEIACEAANWLLNMLEEKTTIEPGDTGLYTGIPGIGFALMETYKASQQKVYYEGTLRCIQMLHQRAHTIDNGIEWEPVYDIISGSAGTGLFLLYCWNEIQNTEALELAQSVAQRLITLQIREENGISWNAIPDFPRIMPNFSHGTAGIAFFLANMYETTHNKIYLESAVKAADYVLSIANENGLVCHHSPGGEDLFYLGWCHGPVGTFCLYYKLWQITGETTWLNAVHRAASALIESGIPETRSDGFWNNVSLCCGNAGIADAFLNLYRISGLSKYLNFAKEITDDMLARAVEEGETLKWIQAENRTQPDHLEAQTGLMQGAAGIGLSLLHMAAFENGKTHKIVLPDSPFRF